MLSTDQLKYIPDLLRHVRQESAGFLVDPCFCSLPHGSHQAHLSRKAAAANHHSAPFKRQPPPAPPTLPQCQILLHVSVCASTRSLSFPVTVVEMFSCHLFFWFPALAAALCVSLDPGVSSSFGVLPLSLIRCQVLNALRRTVLQRPAARAWLQVPTELSGTLAVYTRLSSNNRHQKKSLRRRNVTNHCYQLG